MRRLLSHSEVSTALDCAVKHAFSYTGVLTGGDTLSPKTVAPKLRAGRAWGRAIAAWHEDHATVDSPELRKRSMERAVEALNGALREDADEQQEHGVFDPSAFQKHEEHLLELLGDYIVHADPITLTRPEHELQVPIPSRGGIRRSNTYTLQCFLDGIHTDSDGRDWIVEFKLRGQLQSLDLIAKQRQTRWYSWAWREATGRPVAGIIVEERLDTVPAAVRRNINGSLSKVQSCRPDAYTAAGGIEEDVLEKLRGKRWEQRHSFVLTERELDEAGQQLTSAASLIHQLDIGALYPIRSPSPMRCPGCAFRDICIDYTDAPLIDALFERTVPKRLHEPVPA